jgi:hypothetical protein
MSKTEKFVIVETSSDRFSLCQKSIGKEGHFHALAQFRSLQAANKICQLLNREDASL